MKPSETPVTMFWMRARVRPCWARDSRCVVGTVNDDLVLLNGHGDVLMEILLKGALGALDDAGVAIDCHFDSSGNLDRLPTDTRHGGLLSFYTPKRFTKRMR